MGLTHKPDRLPGPVFPFSLGVLATRRVGDQAKNVHPKCVLVVLRLPQKGRIKCSLHSNTEPKQPNSGRSSPAHRVRRTKRGNSAILSRSTRRLPKTKNGWQSISIRRFNGKELRQPSCPCRRRRATFEVSGRGRADA